MSPSARPFFVACVITLMLVGCGEVPAPVPTPLPSAVSGVPSPCEGMALAGFPRKDPPDKSTYFVCKPGTFALNYSLPRLTPQWTIQKITNKDMDPSSGPGSRMDIDDSRPDPATPFTLPGADAIKEKGYIRSYLASPASFPFDDLRYSTSQYLSNSFPLHPDRKVIWDDLTKIANAAAQRRGEVVVIAGTIYNNGVGLGFIGLPEQTTSNIGKIEIPSAVFKVIIDAKSGEYIAFVVPNNPLTAGEAPASTATWSQIQSLTSLVLAPDSTDALARFQSSPPDPSRWMP